MSTIGFAGVAGRWLECLPLGDGRLGVMTDGGVAATTLHLNDATAWSGSPESESEDGLPDAAVCARLLEQARQALAAGDPIGAERPLQAMQTRYAQSYLPLGRVIIRTADDGRSEVFRQLDLRSGIHRAQDAATGAATTTFISAEHSVLVHVVEGAGPAKVALASPLRGPDGAEPEERTIEGDTALLLRLPSDVAPGHEPDLPAARWDGPALEAAIATRVLAEGDRTIVLVATATTFDRPGRPPRGSAQDALNEARRRLDRVAGCGADELRDGAAEAMRSLLGDVALTFDTPATTAEDEDRADTAARFTAARVDPRGILAADPGLVSLLFDYGRYLLVCASRRGILPVTLQGLWNDQMRPPWGSGYTLNINTEMNYWGAHVTDLALAARPLTELTIALSEQARTHTARLYGAPGWTVHHNTDAWLYATSPGRGTGDPRWSFWPLGGAWLASLLTEAWEFGAADESDLARIWPALRSAAEFALAWLHDGNPRTSPENAFLTADGRPASLVRRTTMDTALLRMVLQRTVRTAAAIGLADDPVVTAAAARADTLSAQPTIAPDGTIVEWDAARPEEDPHHRHLSSLFGLFPGEEHWDHDRRTAAARTLARRGDDSSGWSLIWKLALWARLERPDRVADLLALAMRDADETTGPWAGGLYPNLFASHPPFQIDANLGFVGAIAETVLQSHDGIHLLPAVPADLPSGRAIGLIARPGIIVGIRWRNGVLESATLRARGAASAGEHRVRWHDHEITVSVRADRDTILDARSFDIEETHP